MNSQSTNGLETASSAGTVAPNMLGDMLGVAFIQNRGSRGLTPSDQVLLRYVRRFKIAEYNSPIPVRRLIADFQYYNDAQQTSATVTRSSGGLEWTFMDGQASIEVQESVDYFGHLTGLDNKTQAGDVRAILKFVLHRDDAAGVVVAAGLGGSFPTAPLPVGLPKITYLSPYAAFLLAPKDSPWYFQGFEQIDTPLDGRDKVLIQSSVGLGYWLRRYQPNSYFTRIAPTVELHMYNPIGAAPSRELTGLIYRDVLNVATGVTFFIRERVRLAAVFNAPLTSGRDYAFEAQVHLDVRF